MFISILCIFGIRPTKAKSISNWIDFRKKRKKFYLEEGRLRFWAYVIAYGWKYSINVILKN